MIDHPVLDEFIRFKGGFAFHRVFLDPFNGFENIQQAFALALILMIVSLGISLRELQISVGALDLLLVELEDEERLG